MGSTAQTAQSGLIGRSTSHGLNASTELKFSTSVISSTAQFEQSSPHTSTGFKKNGTTYLNWLKK